MSETTTAVRLVIGQDCPEHGGVYIGIRVIDGQTHHIFTPVGTSHDIKSIEFSNIGKAVAGFGEINGHSDWRAPDQEDLMLAYINARDHFERSGMASIYWSRTPCGTCLAWAVGFENGNVGTWTRRNEFRVRPFRSIITSSL